MAAEWVPTAGLAGQVFDGPCCYIDSWDMAFQQQLRLIATAPGVSDRRQLLAEIERDGGPAARRRMESALKRIWKKGK